MTITREQYPFGVLVSSKQGMIDWSILAPHIDYAIARAAQLDSPEMTPDQCLDYQFTLNCNEVYKLGKPFGASILHYPKWYEQQGGGAAGIEGIAWSEDKQVQSLIKAITFSKDHFRKVDFIVVQFYRFWINQAKFESNGETADNTSASNVILLSARAFLNNIATAQKEGMLPNVPVIPASADWFIIKHTDKGLYDTFYNRESKVMEAKYRSIPANTHISWDQLPNFYPVITDTFHPTGLNGTCHIWEFTDEITLPTALGNQSSFPLSVLWKKDAFYNSINYVPGAVIPEIPPEPGTIPSTGDLTGVNAKLDALDNKLSIAISAINTLVLESSSATNVIDTAVKQILAIIHSHNL